METPPKRALSREQSEFLRQLPSVDELLAQPRLSALGNRVDRGILVEVARAVLAEFRARVTGEITTAVVAAMQTGDIEARIAEMVERILAHSLVPVINATGVILHTNLGRAPLPAALTDQLRQTATQYCNLEYDLEAGARGKRDVHTSRLIERLTGAEAAIVVNNCAAAMLLSLAALAKGGEVIASRGELIEIGDGFRIPEIMAESGAILREVGTTNRTRITDYEKAINERTRLLLRVHPSNFRITGFTERPSLEEFVEVGKRRNVPTFEDLGSGCMIDVAGEPLAADSIRAGVDVICFSGDKMLGGPQAGIIAGKKLYVEKTRQNPLFRALRVDKLTISTLEHVLRLYLKGALDEIPVVRMLR